VWLDRLLYEQSPINKYEIIHRSIIKSNEPDVINQLLLDFFSKLHDATGTARRAEYCGFPPNRPGSAL
jgi:hypothetical protein